MVRLVLFDIDGTLIQSGGAGEKAFARVCASVFNTPSGTAQLQFAGRTDFSIVRDFFELYQIDPTPANFSRFFDDYVFWLDHLLESTPGRVLPGVQRLIDDLQARPTPPLIGLLTGNVRLGAQIKLTHYQLWDFFRTGGFGDDHEDRSQVAAVALARGNQLLQTKLAGDEILVVGDTPRDISCAKAISAKVLAVATGKYAVAQLKEHQPSWALASLEEISAEELCQ